MATHTGVKQCHFCLHSFYRSFRDPFTHHSWQRAMHTQGWDFRMCVELIVGCAQPYGWKITSVETNVELFLSGGGSEGGHWRSLWPQHLAPCRSEVVWFTLRSILPVQPVNETRSLHIRMVTVIQSVCPSTEIKFGKHLRCFEVGTVAYIVGSAVHMA